MSDDGFGPGMSMGDWLSDAAKALGMDNGASTRAMQTQLAQRSGEDRAMAAKILHVFSTKDGAAVLEWLVANTLRRDEVPVDLLMTTPSDQIMAHSLFRAGENSTVKLILLAMAQAQNKPTRRRKS